MIMKNYESLGMFIGAAIGAVLTGISIYFTGSIWSALICSVCFYAGGWIGKEIVKK